MYLDYISDLYGKLKNGYFTLRTCLSKLRQPLKNRQWGKCITKLALSLRTL